MPEPLFRTSMPAPSLGVNNSNDLFSVRSNQVYRAKNCHLDESGMLYTRGGCRTLNSDALDGAVTSIYDYWRPDGSGQIQITLVTAGKRLYKWRRDNDTFEELKELSNSDRPTWASFYEGNKRTQAYMCNGTDFFRFDGNTFTDITFVSGYKAPRYILVYDDRMLAAGMDNAPYDVQVCEELDATDWTYGDPEVANEWSVNSTTGNRITGLALAYNFALFFQRDSVNLITGADVTSSATEQITVSRSYGSTSHWSIQSIGNSVYFADENHIYRGVLRQAVENGLEVLPIDRNIRRKYKTVSGHNDIVSVFNKNTEEVYWGVNCNVGNKKDTALVYSVEHSGQKVDIGWIDVWAGWWDNGASYEPHTYGLILNADNIPEIWRGDSSGYVYIHEETDTEGSYNQFKDFNAASSADIPTEIVTGAVQPSGLTSTKKLQLYTPIISQFHNASTYIQWLINGSKIMPRTQRDLTLQSDIPFWNDTSNDQTTTLWGKSVFTHNVYIARPVGSQEPFNYLQIIIRNDGTNTKDAVRYGGGEIAYTIHNPTRAQG